MRDMLDGLGTAMLVFAVFAAVLGAAVVGLLWWIFG